MSIDNGGIGFPKPRPVVEEAPPYDTRAASGEMLRTSGATTYGWWGARHHVRRRGCGHLVYRALSRSAASGDLKYYHVNGNTYLVASVDGDNEADLQIEIAGLHALAQTTSFFDQTGMKKSQPPVGLGVHGNRGLTLEVAGGWSCSPLTFPAGESCLSQGVTVALRDHSAAAGRLSLWRNFSRLSWCAA